MLCGQLSVNLIITRRPCRCKIVLNCFKNKALLEIFIYSSVTTGLVFHNERKAFINGFIRAEKDALGKNFHRQKM